MKHTLLKNPKKILDSKEENEKYRRKGIIDEPPQLMFPSGINLNQPFCLKTTFVATYPIYNSLRKNTLLENRRSFGIPFRFLQKYFCGLRITLLYCTFILHFYARVYFSFQKKSTFKRIKCLSSTFFLLVMPASRGQCI